MTKLERFHDLFGRAKPVIGMVHLDPLPGAPRFSGPLGEVIEKATADAAALLAAPVDGLMIENFNDNPFYPETTEPETIASMTLVAAEIAKMAAGRPIGVNVLRNSWKASLAIAHVVGASFIRLNVFTDALITDQGIINGVAHLAVRYRGVLGAENVRIFADLYSKHGAPLAERPLPVVARDMAYRAMADAIIVSGEETGVPPRQDEVSIVKDAVPDCPVLLGSGIAEENVNLLRYADGVIFGTGAKRDRIIANPVDPQRVRRFVSAVRALGAR